ncbi:transposase, IS4 family protein [Burkholderia lata]|nr:transposase, IS4 family protein [Burkholderia lata]
MRGADGYNESLFNTVRLEEFVPQAHPLRQVRIWLNEALSKMDAKFSAMYEADAKGGRPSIAPEKLCCKCCTASVASGSRLPRTAPRKPCSFINRPTVQRATTMPSRFICFQTFGTP